MRHTQRRARTLIGALGAALAAALAAQVHPMPVAAQNREEILSYDVTVDVEDGARMAVTENIVVRALGDEIKRGTTSWSAPP